jgi:hypothetical protein
MNRIVIAAVAFIVGAASSLIARPYWVAFTARPFDPAKPYEVVRDPWERPGTPEPQSLNECVLAQMRGVPIDLLALAAAVCQRRLPGQSFELPGKKPNPFDQFDEKR